MSVRAVLVGCGAMSRGWIRAATEIPDLQLVGFADIDAERARGAAASYGNAAARVETDVAQLLEQTRPDVLFDVAVPAARHELVSLALAHGCHVLTEKPMAETLGQARDLVAKATAANRIHAVIQNRRYIAGLRRIKRLMATKVLGKVTSIHCDFFLAPHFGGFREEMSHVLLIDMAIHIFDSARVFAAANAEAVYCREWEPPGSWYRQGSSAAAIFEMTGGAVFTFCGSWCAKGLGTSWESNWRIVCENGSIAWDGEEGLRAETAAPPREGLFDTAHPFEVAPLHPEDRVGGHLGVLQDFVAAVQGGPLPETQGTDNINSLAMVIAATRSAEAGQRVVVKP
jgi:predicted dehydrogenase